MLGGFCLLSVACTTGAQSSDPQPPSEPAPQEETAPQGEAAPQEEATPREEAAPRGPETIAALPPTPEPLRPEQQAVFEGTSEDAPAQHLLGVTKAQEGRHYVAGNEKRLDAFKTRLDGIGGAYVGVGSDQAYMFMGWGRFDLAWLIDYDPVIIDTHAIYRAFLLRSNTPAEFLDLWSKDGKDTAIQELRDAYDGDQEERVVAVYKRYRGWVDRRLRGLEKRYLKLKVPIFITDQAQYDFVRAMVRNGRVRPMQANLLELGAILEVGKAARELSVPVRVFYLSNAEQYWDAFPDEYRRNVSGLFFDERSVVLHTLLTWGKNQDYRYVIQPAVNYVEWLARPWFTNVSQMVPKPAQKQDEEPGTVHYREFEQNPDESRAAKRAEKAAQGTR